MPKGKGRAIKWPFHGGGADLTWRSCIAVIETPALKSKAHTSAETHGMMDEDNPLDEIDNPHDKMEKFMRAHSGYDRANLQGWMNLFWLLANGPRNKMDKGKWFFEMAFSKKIRIKYRGRFRKIKK